MRIARWVREQALMLWGRAHLSTVSSRRACDGPEDHKVGELKSVY